jgi:AraC-like DNA-binding protein
MSSELTSLIEANTRIDGTFPTPIPGLHLSRFSSRTQPCHAVQCPTLAIVAQGSKQIMLGDEAFTYAPGHCLVVSLDLPVSARVTAASKTKPFLGMSLGLDVKQIPAFRSSGKIQRATKPDCGVFLSRVTPELLDPVLRLLRLLGKPEDSAVLAPLLQREILYRLWRSEQGEQLERMAQSDGNASGVVKAVIWLKENFDKPFSIKLIAQETNMSPSGLHHHFKTLTNMTPLQYQKHLRLQEARRLMLVEALDASAAAYHVGYVSRTQFTREYSRLFGAPPLRDVEQIRQQPQPAELSGRPPAISIAPSMLPRLVE